MALFFSSSSEAFSAALDYKIKGDFKQAEEILEHLVTENPNQFLFNYQLGILKIELNKLQEADVYLKRTLLLKHEDDSAFITLASILSGLGNYSQALHFANKALKLNNRNEDNWACLGSIHLLMGSLELALMAIETALLLNSSKAKHWSLLGSFFTLKGNYLEAINCHTKALQFDPKEPDYYHARAIAFQGCHAVNEALADLDYLLTLDSSHTKARSTRLFVLNYLDTLSTKSLYHEHLDYASRLKPNRHNSESRLDVIRSRSRTRKIRLAFISPDLRRHSVAYFIEPLFKYLDSTIFDLYVYYDYTHCDEVTFRLKDYVYQFRHVSGIPTPRLKTLILEDGIDCLVDLAGHTGMNRMDLFHERAAPVQISYLGYPNTTGLKQMDYRFTDTRADPVGESDTYFTETLIRFSTCGWAYLPDPALYLLKTTRVTRKETITFGSFNSVSKLNHFTLSLWAEVLKHVDASCLVVKCSPLVKENLTQKLRAASIDLGRVQFIDSTQTHHDHLALYSLIDIALDPFPYNGTTTTLEAVAMGVPVVTLVGDRHASRVGLSLLTAIGLESCIAYTSDEYVKQCKLLASDKDLRQTLRTTLRQRLLESIICDGPKQAALFGTKIISLIEGTANESKRGIA